MTDSNNDQQMKTPTATPTGTVNQCDGCQAGAFRFFRTYWPWSKEHWYHRFSDGTVMSCEKDKYE